MAIEMVEVPRWWIVMTCACLQGDIPSGPIGDNVFLLRDQLKDIVDRHDKAAQDQRDVASNFVYSG